MSGQQTITFVVSGRLQRGSGGDPTIPTLLPGRVRETVRVATLRAGAERQRLVARVGEDAVALHLAGGPVLVLHPETARDLLLSQTRLDAPPAPDAADAAGGRPAGGTRSAAEDAGGGTAAAEWPIEVELPPTLAWPGLEQAAPTRGAGFLGRVVVTAVQILGGPRADALVEAAAERAAEAIARRLDGQVADAVHELRADRLPPLKQAPAVAARAIAPRPGGQPVLVLAHGTFVDTASTFARLWDEHPTLVRRVFAHHEDRVYALDHPTLGQSPIQNALTLARALGDGVRLNLVTHSRGGLVAEVLARVAADPDAALADFDRLGEQAAADAGADAEHARRARVWREAAPLLRAQLAELADELRGRGVAVDRVVRVACPARGTLLASGRLDAYLSVLKWTLELAGLQATPLLVDFLGAVARERHDWTSLPGLAAMTPDNPLLQWLNAGDASIPGELRVVAGDLEADGVGSWLKTLMADAFYWTDNDIVVQTRSMYGGAHRAGGASFLLDRGGRVTHFDYFRNPRTATAVAAALTEARPHGFDTIGPLSWAGRDADGWRAGASRDDGRAATDLPAVFVLPGILGSNLAVGGRRIWIGPHFVGGLRRLRYAFDRPDEVRADGAVESVYGALLRHLAQTHEVVEFGYDWRRPLEDEARRLAAEVASRLDARAASGQPVRLLAHSMGGLLARTMQLECPDVWTRMMSSPGARLVMLGTPNGGSWSPMQVLSGDDTFGNAVAAFGLPLRDHEARTLMAGFPGFLQLQAGLLDGGRGLDDPATWQQLADRDLDAVQRHNWWHRPGAVTDGLGDTVAAYRWGVPGRRVLDSAVALRRRLDAQFDAGSPAALAPFADRMLLVTGRARFTPDGFEWSERGLVYLDAVDGGDGRVTLHSALLPGVRTWTLDAAHGDLPAMAGAFDAYVELLERGDTARLARLSVARGATAAPAVQHVRSRPARGRAADALPARDVRSLFSTDGRGPGTDDAGRSARRALRVSVLNGNLAFVRQPLIVGHYDSLKLEGTESAVDALIGGAMGDALALGLYPNALGSWQVFVNPAPASATGALLPRPEAAIVVGLGPEGGLSTTQLAACVRRGVLGWAQRLVETGGGGVAGFEIAATLLGSGGIGITPGSAARAIAQGVREANERLAGVKWPQAERLVLVELYLERASEAWRGLRVQDTADPGTLEVDPHLASGPGALRRSLDAYRGTDYDLIRVASPAGGMIDFTLDSRRARSEVRARNTQGPLIAEIVGRASRHAHEDAQLGSTLFQLLVPVELEPFLGGTTTTVLEVDETTAPIPWELLETPAHARAAGAGATRPWAIRSRLLRKLRVTQYRESVGDAGADDAVLVVGEPSCQPKTGYGRLPGARAEARAVADLFRGAGGVGEDRVVALIARDDGGDDALTIVNALMARRYRIVHIAGHGEAGADGGVVLSGGTFLGPKEVEAMRTVPELVFVNCCHAGRSDDGRLLAGPQVERGALAAGLARSLIGIGVRCVVAAGWAVDDRGAETFATALYRALLAGSPFIDAVASARDAAWAGGGGGTTWAAYQCYGDPNWTFRESTADGQAPRRRDDEDEIASQAGLALVLEEIAIGARFGTGAGHAERLARLEGRFEAIWGGSGATAEAFGRAWAEVGQTRHALRWYAAALAADDGGASLRAAEQFADLGAHAAWARVEHAAAALAAARAGAAATRRAAADGSQPAGGGADATAGAGAGAADGSRAASRTKRRPARRQAAAADAAAPAAAAAPVPAPGDPAARRMATAQAELDAALGDGRRALDAAVERLRRLLGIAGTVERQALVGSAHRRRVMLERVAGDAAAERDALVAMHAAYAEAERLARERLHPELHDVAARRLAAELLLRQADGADGRTDLQTLAELRQQIERQMAADPQFRLAAGLVELDWLAALTHGEDPQQGLAARVAAIRGRYEALRSRVAGARHWAPVAERAGFVLAPWAASRGKAARDAADELQALLDGWAAG